MVAAAVDAVYALTLAVVVAAVYLLVVRLMDANEREPLWALLLALVAGALVAAITRAIVGGRILELETWTGAVSREVGRFVALALVLAAFAGLARLRGWSEVSGPMDGVVYGTAVGLGFAVGEAFVRELAAGGALASLVTASPFEKLWGTALAGLSEGLFGAVLGAGFGAAVVLGSAAGKAVAALAGLGVAIGIDGAYRVLAYGGALGSQATLRAWVALLLPLAFVVAVVVYALARERRAIREELVTEASTGAVTPDDLRLLSSFSGRRAAYAGRFFKGDFDGWLALRALHGRQVQLALAKHRAGRESDPGRRARSEAEVSRLRDSVMEVRRELQAAGSEGG